MGDYLVKLLDPKPIDGNGMIEVPCSSGESEWYTIGEWLVIQDLIKTNPGAAIVITDDPSITKITKIEVKR